MRTHDSVQGGRASAIQRLDTEYSVAVKQHPSYPNLYLFKYDKSCSSWSRELVQECRGIILDSDNDWGVVSMPYKKFFRHDEALAPAINWKVAKTWEKLDGTLMTMYRYDGDWHVSTPGVPDAGVRAPDSHLTFAELFWRTAEKQKMNLGGLDTNYCFMFELCTTENRVVVKYPKDRLVLHGVRHIPTLREVDPMPFGTFMGAELPKLYDLSSLEAAFRAAQELVPVEGEGYVVYDGINRIKVKNLGWSALHHAKDVAESRKKLALVCRNGDVQKFWDSLEEFPDVQEKFNQIHTKYLAIIQKANETFESIRFIEDQKEYALKVMQIAPELQAILFSMRKTGCNPKAFMANMSEQAFFRLMGIK
jgi:hypothetical protein